MTISPFERLSANSRNGFSLLRVSWHSPRVPREPCRTTPFRLLKSNIELLEILRRKRVAVGPVGRNLSYVARMDGFQQRMDLQIYTRKFYMWGEGARVCRHPRALSAVSAAITIAAVSLVLYDGQDTTVWSLSGDCSQDSGIEFIPPVLDNRWGNYGGSFFRSRINLSCKHASQRRTCRGAEERTERKTGGASSRSAQVIPCGLIGLGSVTV